jgi:hypothetical protein
MMPRATCGHLLTAAFKRLLPLLLRLLLQMLLVERPQAASRASTDKLSATLP